MGIECFCYYRLSSGCWTEVRLESVTYRDTEDMSTEQSPLLEHLDKGEYGLVRGQLHHRVVSTGDVVQSHGITNVRRKNPQTGATTPTKTTKYQSEALIECPCRRVCNDLSYLWQSHQVRADLTCNLFLETAMHPSRTEFSRHTV